MEQGLGFLQVQRVETLGEPAIDRGEKIVGLLPFALIAPINDQLGTQLTPTDGAFVCIALLMGLALVIDKLEIGFLIVLSPLFRPGYRRESRCGHWIACPRGNA